MNNILLSIIVPVYNVQDYIERCLKSIIDSDLQRSQYEVIVVNDGTKDSSMLIVNDYAKKYEHIKVFEQVNQGLSSARNTGMAHAVGKYIWFVDSDDYIDSNVANILQKAIESNTDVLRFNSIWVYRDRSEQRLLPNFIGQSISGFEYLRKFGTSAVWTFLYKREFLLNNDIKFIVHRLHEDDPFNYEVCLKAKDIMYVPDCVYYYDKSRETSITNTMTAARILSYINNVIHISSLIQQKGFNRNQKSIAYCRNLDYLNELFSFHKSMSSDTKTLLYDNLKNNRFTIFNIYLSSRRLANLIKGLLFLFSPKILIKSLDCYRSLK